MTTLLGFVIGAGLLFYAIFAQGGIAIFWNVPSLMIVGGGTFAALVISFPLPRILRVVGVLLQIFKSDFQKPSWVIKLMVVLSFKARLKSLLAMESEINSVENRVIRLGMELVVDGQTANIIREVFKIEARLDRDPRHSGEHVFR